MSSAKWSRGQVELKLTLWDNQAQSMRSDELYARLLRLGLPENIVSMLHDLILKVERVGRKVIAIGKIILMKLLEFLEKNLGLVAGIGIGALLSSALVTLMGSVPIVGALLLPIAKAMGIVITATGAVLGKKVDTIVPDLGKTLLDIAKDFFQLLVDIFKAMVQPEVNPFYSTGM
ncbi:MAG: hypothetical protein WBA43_14250 [Elainellaceae cyanobacterium]